MPRRLCQKDHVSNVLTLPKKCVNSKPRLDYNSRTTPEGVTQLDGLQNFSIHSSRRKPWVKAISPANLKEYEPVIIQKVHELIDEIGKRQGEVVDISHWITLFG
jgi:cytochrome P450